ncbi:hypothetical protein Pse7367_3171 [Thalassoporum mexicanum PCC 7367]|nr:hypothetical protein Pse7367_3171 [Pseudanabaena sp. PCC 7367]
MSNVYILVEGQTEFIFISEFLSEFFRGKSIYLFPIVTRTSKTAKGGIVIYSQVKPQLEQLCKEHPNEFVTTMIDLYGLPNDFPGKDSLPNITDPYQKVEYLEQSLASDLNCPNFYPNIMLHEFETLLFSDPKAFRSWFNDEVVNRIEVISRNFETPEHINDGVTTAPSKRIIQCCKGYDKILHGSTISLDIGLDTIRNKCRHFDDWLNKLMTLV